MSERAERVAYAIGAVLRGVVIVLVCQWAYACQHPPPPVALPDPLAHLPRCKMSDPHPLVSSCGDMTIKEGPYCVVCADRACLDDQRYVWCVSDLCDDHGSCK